MCLEPRPRGVRVSKRAHALQEPPRSSFHPQGNRGSSFRQQSRGAWLSSEELPSLDRVVLCVIRVLTSQNSAQLGWVCLCAGRKAMGGFCLRRVLFEEGSVCSRRALFGRALCWQCPLSRQSCALLPLLSSKPRSRCLPGGKPEGREQPADGRGPDPDLVNN